MQWIKRQCAHLAGGCLLLLHYSWTPEKCHAVDLWAKWGYSDKENIMLRSLFPQATFDQLWCVCSAALIHHIWHTESHLFFFYIYIYCRLEDNLPFMHSAWKVLHSTLTRNGNSITTVIISCSKSTIKWVALPLNAVGVFCKFHKQFNSGTPTMTAVFNQF